MSSTSSSFILEGVSFIMAANGHALAMAGQFMIFCPNVCPVNEQKVEIIILLLNREFSARNYSPIANKKLMKCTSALLSPMRMLCVRFSCMILKKLIFSLSLSCHLLEYIGHKKYLFLLRLFFQQSLVLSFCLCQC